MVQTALWHHFVSNRSGILHAYTCTVRLSNAKKSAVIDAFPVAADAFLPELCRICVYCVLCYKHILLDIETLDIRYKVAYEQETGIR